MRWEGYIVIGFCAAVFGVVAWSFCRAAAEADDQVWGEPDPERGCASGPRHSRPQRTAPPASIREWCDQQIREQVAARHQPGWDLPPEIRLGFRQTLAEIEALPTVGERA
jgi:hypothetical protein